MTHGAGWAVCPWGIDLRFGAGGTATVREGVQMADADGHYAFTHGGADEGRRLDLLAARLDPLTKRRIGLLGLAPDVCCLEVGSGRGSIVRWLSQDVAPLRAGHRDWRADRLPVRAIDCRT